MFKREIARASLEITVQQVTDTAGKLAQTFAQPLALDTFSPLADRQAQAALLELVHRHPNIQALLLVDTEGRILMGRVGKDTPSARIFQDVARMGRQVRGLGETPLLEAIRTEIPHVRDLKISLVAGPVELGWLRVFLDPQMPHAAVDLAATRMTFKLMALFMVLAGLVFYFGGVIRRQTRLTSRLRGERDEVAQWAYVGTLAAGLAHEIRNPINALTMQFDLLEEDLEETGRADLKDVTVASADRLHRIRQGLVGVERTVRDFLRYAAPETPKPGWLDLAVPLAPLREDWQSVAAQNDPPAELSWNVPANLQCWFDAHALRQVVNNLVQNALRAQAGLGRVPRVALEAYRSGQGVALVVDDAGPGVSVDARSEVFTCFYSTRPDGTGLGLPIARRLAELNGGALALSPDPSPLGGARFVLTLPTRPAKSIAAPSGSLQT